MVDEIVSRDAAIPRERGSLDESVMPRRNRSKMIAAAGGAALVVAAVAILVMLSSGSAASPASAIVEITVKEVVNQVKVDQPRNGATTAANFLPVTIGQELLPGDSLQTFDGSEARVDISVGEFVRVSRTKPNTVWRLGQFSVDAETIIEFD